MSAPRSPVAIAAAAQREASDPLRSAWVRASAGTGKTSVLTDRIMRLLLAGTAPERLLCLTFTRAAAAEMRNRLAKRLAGWATDHEGALADKLAALLGRAPTQTEGTRARTLFARALEAPGGLKIETFHGFCQSVLRRFPIEAHLLPGFRLADEPAARAAQEDALAAVLSEPADDAAGDSGTMAAALARIAARAGEDQVAGLLKALAAEGGRLELMRASAARIGPERALRERLGFPPGWSRAAALAQLAAPPDAQALAALAKAMIGNGVHATTCGQAIADWLALPPQDRVAEIDLHLQAFLKKDGEPRSPKQPLPKAVRAAFPDAVRVYLDEQARIVAIDDWLRLDDAAADTLALLRLALAQRDRYVAAKEREGLLDFDDLIRATQLLLKDPGAAWVLYKLDGGIEHVLVDEAQDTNQQQWQIIHALTDEFFAGAGAHGGAHGGADSDSRARTVFAVGDPKQSIFSFQRADPVAFKLAQDAYAAQTKAAGRPLRTVPLDVSFRSTQAVLRLVDRVFADPAVREGVLLGNETMAHGVARAGQAGSVELWPLVAPDEAEDPSPFTVRRTPLSEPAPPERLARALAETIAAWIKQGTVLASTGAPIGPGDVLVLVRKRLPFVPAFVAACKQRGLAVAGADRMRLAEQLAVMDLLALCDVLLLPEDDLTLAAVLKGPLVGFGEDDLYALAQPRQGTLWGELRRRAAERPIFGRALAFIEALRARADFVSPYRLLAEILTEHGGRKALLDALGPEVDDPLDELLAAAIAYEREQPPSLQGFVHWLRVAEIEIKRDMAGGGAGAEGAGGAARGEIRVMTVHGAKGLQAPVVILPDTVSMPVKTPEILWTRGDEPPPVPLWVRGGARDRLSADLVAEAQRKQAEEHRRLLYVALTRAADRLLICGWSGKRAPSDQCWHGLVARAMQGLAAEGRAAEHAFTAPGPAAWSGTMLRLEENAGIGTRTESAAVAAVPAAPAWLHAPAPAEPSPSRPLAPSRAWDEEPAVTPPLAAGADASAGDTFRRGLILHRLLLLLPELAPDDRAAAARRFLARPTHGLAAADQGAMAREALDVLAAPEAQALFGPQSRGEVPIAGIVATARGPATIAGQIDRLAVRDDAILVADYKTGRRPPDGVAATPDAYIRQMALYRALLQRIFPDRPVRCALLWTAGPRLDWLPEDRLDAAVSAASKPSA